MVYNIPVPGKDINFTKKSENESYYMWLYACEENYLT
jgi:hypothetical protein